jgi:hypothetical protein
VNGRHVGEELEGDDKLLFTRLESRALNQSSLKTDWDKISSRVLAVRVIFRLFYRNYCCPRALLVADTAHG